MEYEGKKKVLRVPVKLGLFVWSVALRGLFWGRLKMRDWNYRRHQKCRDGKCRTGIIGTILQGVENARLVQVCSCVCNNHQYNDYWKDL